MDDFFFRLRACNASRAGETSSLRSMSDESLLGVIVIAKSEIMYAEDCIEGIETPWMSPSELQQLPADAFLANDA